MDDDQRPPAMLLLLFGQDPPGEEALALRLSADAFQTAPLPPSPPDDWALEVRHEDWGIARLVGPKPDVRVELLPPAVLVSGSPHLTSEEVESVQGAKSVVALTLADEAEGPERALRQRKRLLRFGQAALGADGLAVVDIGAQRVWSPAELEDELSHGADLDPHGIFGLHAVTEEEGEAAGRVTWLHSHGLAALGAFDFDIVNPSPCLLFLALWRFEPWPTRSWRGA